VDARFERAQIGGFRGRNQRPISALAIAAADTLAVADAAVYGGIENRHVSAGLMIVDAYVSDGRQALVGRPGSPDLSTKMGDFLEAASGVGPEGYQLVHAPVGRLDPLCTVRRAMGHQAEARMV